MGGSGTPPDKGRGYKVITLDLDNDQAGKQLTAAMEAGFEVTAVIGDAGFTRVILGNYKKG